MKYQTYIFDLDGTLLDTLDDLAASVNFALRTHGMPEHSHEEIRNFVGNGVRLLMERAVPNGVDNPFFEETFATFCQHYMVHSLDTTRPYEGIPETLATLRLRGCRLAVVSNKMMVVTQKLCNHFFPDTIEVAIIPYTFEHTNFCDIKVGTVVNLEFDILGKYIARLQQL